MVREGAGAPVGGLESPRGRQAARRASPIRAFGRRMAWALWAAAAIASPGLQARDVPPLPASQAVPSIEAAALPPQGRDMLDRIRRGGPFDHDKDGVVFGNRERLLPAEARGYYREYTVRTPGARDRGARRIVCGGRTATQPDACFYSSDHYASFRRIVVD